MKPQSVTICVNISSFCLRVQELFKLSLTSPELRLRVVKASGLEGLRKPPPPVYPCYPDDKENVSMVECEQKRKYNIPFFQIVSVNMELSFKLYEMDFNFTLCNFE